MKACLDAALARPGWRKALEAFCPEGVCSVGQFPAPARAFVLAGLRALHPDRAFCLTAPDIRHQEELAHDLEAWGCPVLFFPELTESAADSQPDPDLAAERMAVLRKLRGESSAWVLTTESAVGQPVPDPQSLAGSMRRITKGKGVPMDLLAGELIAAGYIEERLVAQRGQFARRGGIMDVFSWHAALPLRVEWFGDEVDGLREFDPAEQQSVRSLESAEIQLADPSQVHGDSTLEDYLPPDGLRVVWEEPEEEKDNGEQPEAAAVKRGGGAVWELFLEHGFLQSFSPDPVLQENRRQLLAGHMEDWVSEGWSVWLSCNNEGEQQRLREWITESFPRGRDWLDGAVRFVLSPLLRGFVWPAGGMVVLCDAEIFGRYQNLRSMRRQDRLAAVRSRKQAMDFSDLAEGDYVVHVEYGVGLYVGMSEIPAESGEGTRQVMVLQFADEAKLYVPIEQAFLVSRYVGVGRKHPTLDALGGGRWDRAKAQAEKAIMDYAARLLKVQAERQLTRGHTFPADNAWQKEFEGSFLYEPTTDQVTAIEETKEDMESPRPMDRLICGDVGFGKTEVAIRACFKAVMGGKQVAFLVPTTVLAQQHYQNLCERMADYPIKVALLSRFVPKKQQNETIRALREGGVDIVVGTHRVISADIQFKDLGLVVVDEEQRFGVRQKEAFKERFQLVDVLTLSATPIPRTLYMSLMGARDMSTIETPPKNRLSVETSVCAYDERIIREAVQRELARGGQVFFLHNRIHSITQVADRIRFLVPGARVEVGHGQMEEDELEDVMSRFVAGKTDVLVSTTIIESGIDIPNANTIIIDRADRFGLADLYQLRGRVGRAQNRAYAILMLPRDLIKGDAGKRVQAIRQYSQLGAGFKIAMRDLEIRGAGNLLGTAQSGHISAIGFDLYCRLLKRAVSRIKGGKEVADREIQFRLDFLHVGEGTVAPGVESALIPAAYIPDTGWRISAYRELAELQSLDEWTRLRARWKDRYGKWPESVELLLLHNRAKINGLNGNFTRVETQGDKLMLTRNGDFVMVGGKFPRLTTQSAKARLLEIEKWLKSFSAPLA
ncbi:MAG: transcription-repair coupling factor [Candidatus Methylacidiphilales bacterium]|nr:transcription-repair coupling factor [Candidatus Methylacidiphilales bacterium]